MKYLLKLILCVLNLHLILCSASISSSHSNKIDKENSGTCYQKGHCQPLQNATCFGTTLPYHSISIDLAKDSNSLFEVQDNLALWQGLRSVPRCWAVIQPLLCGVYMPKCENGSISLPSQDMCRITRNACKTVELEHGWPSFLKCENKTLFPSYCKNPLKETKFNTTSKCAPPLVETSNPESWFQEIEGCGIPCQNPLYTEKDHFNTHFWIFCFAFIGFALDLFTVMTVVLARRSGKKKKKECFMQEIYFWLNACWVIASLGWLVQFFPGARNETVCARDGTLRQRQPESGHLMCIISYLMCYSFSMAAIVWFVILTYARYAPLGKKTARNDLVKKKGIFHICAWCIPLVLTVITLAISEVDGDSMSGICFVGFSNINMRIFFVLIPVGIAALVSASFLFLTVYKLIDIKRRSEEVANEQAKKKICQNIFITCCLAVSVVVLVIMTFSFHSIDFINKQDWIESLRDYIVCVAMYSYQSHLSDVDPSFPKCVLKSKPNVGHLHIHLFCVLIFGVINSSLIWNKKTIETWKSSFYQLCAPTEKNERSLKRHQLIAQAFQKRHQINQGNFSFTSGPDDPLGLNIDLSSIGSRDISSNFAVAFPQLIYRRNAISGFAPRHHSSVSDVSRHISMDSFNQPNLDSLSMQMSEQEFQKLSWRQRRKTKKERERYLKANRMAPWFPGNRRGSDTSLQSSLLASMAAAGRNANALVKVTKSTSTGDLALQQSIAAETALMASVLPQPRHRTLVQQAIKDPHPFMHGMIDSYNRIDCRNIPSATSSSIGQSFTPTGMASTLRTPLPNVMRPPVLAQNFGMMNNMAQGFIGAGMYPAMNFMYPRYPNISNFPFAAYHNLPYLTYAAYQSFDAMPNQCNPNLIPLHPRPDSASETEYFPIIMSDSEFTDTGFRSYDESNYVRNTQRLMQERLQAQLQIKAQQERSKSAQSANETQACAKTPSQEKLKVEKGTSPDSRPSSSRKTHNAAPPPSPAESLHNENSESTNSDVFNSESITSKTILVDNEESEINDSEIKNLENNNSEDVDSEVKKSENVSEES